MVVPEPLPIPLPSSPEVLASTSAARIVAAPVVPATEFTDAPKRHRFTATYKLRIQAETDRAVDTCDVSAILRRKGRYSSALSDWRGQRAAFTSGVLGLRRRGPEKAQANPLQAELATANRGNAALRRRWIMVPGSGGGDHRHPENWPRCWTRWRRNPRAAADHDGGDGGFDPGQRPDGGGLWHRICRGPACIGVVWR